jgi:cell shape-determining protein MreC
MTQYVSIPGTTLVRDINSMGITNKDVSGLEEYKLKRKLLKTQKDEINNMKSDIISIKEDMTELKQLIHKLIEKG